MRLVVAVGGNALLERGEVPLAEIQEKHVAVAVDALAPLARDHDLVITHGNGPQVGPAGHRERRRPRPAPPLPLRRARRPDPGDDRLLLPPGVRERAAGATGGEPHLPDRGGCRRPGLRAPDQVRRARLHRERGQRLARLRGWQVRPDGALAAGGGLTRAPGHARAADHPHAGGRRRRRDLRRRRRDPGRSAAATAGSAASRPSSTRTSPPPCWPGTSTPTPWCSSPTWPTWRPASAPPRPGPIGRTTPAALRARLSLPVRWVPRSRRPAASSKPPGSRP